MINRIDPNTTRHKESTDRFPANQNKSYPNHPIDDIIGSLANAHENKRARQVNEWEKMRMQNIPIARA